MKKLVQQAWDGICDWRVARHHTMRKEPYLLAICAKIENEPNSDLAIMMQHRLSNALQYYDTKLQYGDPMVRVGETLRLMCNGCVPRTVRNYVVTDVFKSKVPAVISMYLDTSSFTTAAELCECCRDSAAKPIRINVGHFSNLTKADNLKHLVEFNNQWCEQEIRTSSGGNFCWRHCYTYKDVGSFIRIAETAANFQQFIVAMALGRQNLYHRFPEALLKYMRDFFV